jgi:phage terminase large subunit
MSPTRTALHEYWGTIITGADPMDDRALLARLFEAHGLGSPLTPDSLVRAYRRDPALFFVHVLGIVPWVCLDRPGQDQLGILEAVRRHDRVAVRSGHKVAKSNSLAGLALWKFTCYPRARVPITSSSFQQVKKINWYEIKNLYFAAARSGVDIGGEWHEDPQTGLTMPDGREIFGFSTKEAERAAGISGPHNFYEIDEASGVDEPIFEAIEGNRAGGAKIVLYSNPTRTAGTFYDAFHSKRAFWKCIHIPSWHSPNCQAAEHGIRRNVIPGLASPKWIEEKRQEWGEASPLFHVRVGGNFPPQAAAAVIPISLVEDSRQRYDVLEALDVPLEGSTLYLGVDPAYYGDDEAVIYPRRGTRALPPRSLYQSSGDDICQQIIRCLEDPYLMRGVGEVRINIDVIGEGMVTFVLLTDKYGTLMRSKRAVVVPVRVNETSDYPDMYFNKRTQLAFGLKDWLAEGGAIPDDSKLEAEMVAPEYSVDNYGRYKLPPKEQEKKVLGRSPDRRNALELAVYEGKTYTIDFKSAGPRQGAAGNFDAFITG